MRRTIRTVSGPLTLSVVAVVLSSGCRLATLLPRTHTVAASPDGRHTASVRQHFGIDPPNDHLYITDESGSPIEVMALAPDMDWCRAILWTPDSRRVAFLIRDQHLAIFDASSRELTAMLPLVGRDGYPGSLEVRNVVFEDDAGGVVSFDRYERATGRHLGRERVTVPADRLRIRLTTAAGQPVERAFARVRLDDEKEVDVPIIPGTDGVAILAAIDEGPLPIVEIGLPGNPRTVVLEDVAVGSTPLDIVLRPVIPIG
jgi:hypothetical protein